MLYLPLSSEEKFKAKAVIDVFAYRSSKALASLALLASQFFTLNSFDTMLSWALFITFCIWITLVAFFSKKTLLQKS
jgi:ATP/ADP translocase